MLQNFFIFLCLLNLSLYAQSGTISGKITDAKTGEPIIGANVIVLQNQNLGTATNEMGFFIIKASPGAYSLKISCIGYSTLIKSDVIIRTNNNPYLDIKLKESIIETDVVNVTTEYFDKSLLDNNLSTLTLQREEVKRSPGSIQDFQRVLQSMAGVSFSNDKNNELLVRGGAPSENLTIFDDIEIHSTNHYPEESNGSGPINMINVDLIENIEFSTGGFIAKYGDKLSSVMNINSREGSRVDNFKINSNLSMAGVGVIMEGKLNNGKGSWLFSGRKSFIDIIAKNFGLTSIPKYYDGQIKIVYDLSDKHKLSLSGIYGNDLFTGTGDEDQKFIQNANKKDTVEFSVEYNKQNQFAGGITLKSFWDKNFFSALTFFYNNFYSDKILFGELRERNFDNYGESKNPKLINNRILRSSDATNSDFAFKTDFIWNYSKTNEISFGGIIKTIGYESSVYRTGDTVRYDFDNNNIFDKTIINESSRIDYKQKMFSQFKSNFYINNKFTLFDKKLIINLGLRYDYFSYSKKGNLSPRLSFSYNLIPNSTSINFAYGEYYQTHTFLTYTERYGSEINRYLDNSHSRHFVTGIEQILGDGLKASFEFYIKNYDKLPVSEEFIYNSDRTFRSEKQLTIGKSKITGFDFSIQKKLVDSYYGTIAFSKMWSNMDDPRMNYEGKSLPVEFDYPNVFNLILGKRFNNLRKQLTQNSSILNYLLYIIPISDDMELSIKYRYSSGRLFTPKDYVLNEQIRIGSKLWSKGNWVESKKILSERYPDYHRLDISIYSRYNFEKWSLNIYLSLQNILNRKNIDSYSYNSDGTISKREQISFMPVGGIEINF